MKFQKFIDELQSLPKIDKYKLIVVLNQDVFLCHECGWEGIILPNPDHELSMGTYCPRCSDQT
jgi:hypothetical protein